MAPRPRARARARSTVPKRAVNYRNLRNPFPPMRVFSEDAVAGIHDAALHLLQEVGIKVLLPQARAIFEKAGARIGPDDMVFIGREIVTQALTTAPKKIDCRAGSRHRDITLELGNLVFQPGAGAPHATDLVRGRRPGSDNDFRDLVRLTQHFDALHMVPPLVEPQNVAPAVRHYMTMSAQVSLSDKLPFVFARGTPQVMDSFEMLCLARGLDWDAFQAASHCYTIINTNSPRQLDIPMAQGVIDFACAGQVAIITPFTLMGAMAPITVSGALTLSHAEALAAITLSQLTRAGAPVTYGTFTSNVDMKSGAPAFGTPEHFKASLGAGQLARFIGLPWRCASGAAANIGDAQGAHETQFSLWGCLLGGATVVIHAAGWLEGGLSVSYEKLITDMEVVNMVADLCDRPQEDGAPALDALQEVEPGGHFFAAAHTMSRYATEFYEPVIADWSNFGAWSEAGARDATSRATDLWQEILSQPQQQLLDPKQFGALEAFIQKRKDQGGAPPES